jgi:NAD(P)-dependent dehydrogenase (short-subunit alcohol dehydrogenase family)
MLAGLKETSLPRRRAAAAVTKGTAYEVPLFGVSPLAGWTLTPGAAAISFLASPASNYVTGDALDVNGGWWMS